MIATTLAHFYDPDELEAALQKNGSVHLIATGHGEFRAQFTQIRLRRMMSTE